MKTVGTWVEGDTATELQYTVTNRATGLGYDFSGASSILLKGRGSSGQALSVAATAVGAVLVCEPFDGVAVGAGNMIDRFVCEFQWSQGGEVVRSSDVEGFPFILRLRKKAEDWIL
jgi:hypothetical protein